MAVSYQPFQMKDTDGTREGDGTDEQIMEKQLTWMSHRSERLTSALDDCLVSISELESQLELVASPGGSNGTPFIHEASPDTTNQDLIVDVVGLLNALVARAEKSGVRCTWRLSDRVPSRIRTRNLRIFSRIYRGIMSVYSNVSCRVVVLDIDLQHDGDSTCYLSVDICENRSPSVYDRTMPACDLRNAVVSSRASVVDVICSDSPAAEDGERVHVSIACMPMHEDELTLAEQHPLSILIYNSSPMTAAIWQARLALCGYVATVSSREEAVMTRVESSMVDLIITDQSESADRVCGQIQAAWPVDAHPTIVRFAIAEDADVSDLERTIAGFDLEAFVGIVADCDPCQRDL